MNIAFAGFRHGHVYTILNQVKDIPDMKIVAAWEPNEEARETAASRGIEFTHESFDEIISQPNVDIVVIGDYYAARGQEIIKALSAGKHVIADKPICTTLDELDKIEELLKNGNAKLTCMLDLRYTFAVQKAREIVQNGEIGKVHNIVFVGCHQLSYGSRPMWYFEDGKHGGTINDIAVHGVDLINFIVGAKLEKINGARVWNGFATEEPDFKDCAQFMAEFDNGIGVIADVSYAAPVGQKAGDFFWRFTIFGESGTIEFNFPKNNMITLYRVNGKVREEITGSAENRSFLADFVNSLNGEEPFISQEDVISASRAVLKLQKYADDLNA